MTRSLATLDRLAVLLVGLAAIVVGAAAVVWQLDLTNRVRGTVTAPWLTGATTQGWWPWASGAAGVVLVLLAGRWLLAHVPGRKLSDVRLRGSNKTGRLTTDLSALAAAGADSLLGTPGIRSASGRAVDDRGRRTLQLTITLDPTANVTTVTTATDQACRDLGAALGDPGTATRVHLHTARSTKGVKRTA